LHIQLTHHGHSTADKSKWILIAMDQCCQVTVTARTIVAGSITIASVMKRSRERKDSFDMTGKLPCVVVQLPSTARSSPPDFLQRSRTEEYA
jgi:hypothetical protein